MRWNLQWEIQTSDFFQTGRWTWESSFNQISDGFGKNDFHIEKRHWNQNTDRLPFWLVWLPNQGIFGWSGSAISCVSKCHSSSAQHKIPALNGKRNSRTREPLREQTPVSFSILGRYFSFLPQSFGLSCCILLGYTSCRTCTHTYTHTLYCWLDTAKHHLCFSSPVFSS